MTLLTRANRTYLNKVAPNVGDTFTVDILYHIRPVQRRSRRDDPVYDDRYTFVGDRKGEAHLDKLVASGHLRVLEHTKTRRFMEKPLKKGGPDIYFEYEMTESRTFRRRK